MLIPCISTATSAERVYSWNNLSAFSLSLPLSHLSLSKSTTRDADTKGSNNRYSSLREEQYPGTTVPPDRSLAHCPKFSPSPPASADRSCSIHAAHGPSVGTSSVLCAGKLLNFSYKFWFMSLRLTAAVCNCEDHILTDPQLHASSEKKGARHQTFP